MATTTHTPMTRTRKYALAAGLLYIATFVFSIPALGFYDGVLNTSDWVNGAGSAGNVPMGALFEILTGLTGIGTAVMLFPLIEHHGRINAVGLVASRTLEAAVITMGVISLLAVSTLRQDLGGSDVAGLGAVADGLVAVHDWSFFAGPGIMPAVSALCLATVLRRSGLVPKVIPTIGLIGAPILFASSLGTLSGAWEQVSGPALLLAIPIATWELSLGVYLTVKGVRTTDDAAAAIESSQAGLLASAHR